MFKIKANKKIGQILVLFIAIMFVLYGSMHIYLGFFGVKDRAVITGIRRQGGERNEPVPNRYTYVISYSFNLPDGRSIDGFAYKIGNAVYVKVTGSNMNTAHIRYLKALPEINALERDAGLKMGNLIIIGAGILIKKLIKPKSKSKKKSV